MIELTINQLRQLKLNGMASALQIQLDQPGTYEGLAFAERLQLLVDHEDQARHQRKQDRLTRAAQFKLKAHAKDIDYQAVRGLQQSQMASLLMCDWLKKGQNLLLTGPCGTGKTYIACALGQQACLKGYSVKYYRLPRLILALTQAKADGSYSRLLSANAEQLLKFNRDHWGVESHHYLLDWNWHEDRCTIRKGYGPENITCLRRFATGLIQSISKDSVASTIEKLARNVRRVFDYLRMTENSRKVLLRYRSQEV